MQPQQTSPPHMQKQSLRVPFDFADDDKQISVDSSQLSIISVCPHANYTAWREAVPRSLVYVFSDAMCDPS